MRIILLCNNETKYYVLKNQLYIKLNSKVRSKAISLVECHSFYFSLAGVI